MNTPDHALKTLLLLSFLSIGCLCCTPGQPVPAASAEAVSPELTHPRVTTLAEDGTGHVWIGTTHGLNRAIPYGYHQYFAGEDSLSLTDNHIARIYRDRSDRLWVATINGKLCYLTTEGTFTQVPIEYCGNGIMSFLEMPDGTFFCNNEHGIYRFSPENGRMEKIIDTGAFNLGLFPDGQDILVVYPDRLGRYGEDGHVLSEMPFSETCSEATMDPDSILWLSFGPGRHLEFWQQGAPVPSPLSKSLSGVEIREILPYDKGGDLLVNTIEDLLIVNKSTGAVRTAVDSGLPLDKGEYNINCLLQDSRGNIWVGMDGGGVQILPNNKKGSRFHSLQNFFKNTPIQALSYDRDRDILNIVTRKNDVYEIPFGEAELVPVLLPSKYERRTQFGSNTLHLSDGRILTVENNKDLILTENDGATATLLPLSAVKEVLGSDLFIPEELFQDSQRQIWIGTQSNGVVILDPDTHQYRRVSGISCPEVSSITEVGGHVWVATQYGLNEYNLSGELLNTYLAGNGVSSNAFTEHCACVLPGDILLLGTMQGLVVRYPSSRTREISLPFYFEDLRVQNSLITPGKGSPIQAVMTTSPPIRLQHDWNSFSISFSALDYRNTVQGSYSYKLEGFDHFWIDGGDSHEAFYSNIPPGNYTFLARLSDTTGEHIFGSGSVRVTVLPAPWATWWAKTLYALLALSILAVILYFWLHTVRGREKLRQAEAEKRQEQHMSEINKQYFANVAHQLRTPLTMISGPIGTLSSADDIKGKNRTLLTIVRHNVDRMLSLVNQIMDFNALETDALALKVRRLDILPILRNTLDIYQVNAEEKGITFLSDGLEGNAFVHADADKIVNILDNLLSNAFKYTPQGGFISVSFTEMAGQASLKVSNSGPAIPEGKLERIFERYYQLDGPAQHGRYNWGSGVGLYYARKLAQLHHGTLTCANAEDGAGVCFTLVFPTEGGQYSPEEKDTGTPGHLMQSEKTAGDSLSLPPGAEGEEILKPAVLVVDDDTDITFYLRTLLSPHYRVTCCYDVESARKLLTQQIPDIILSDIMMNGQTGLDFCDFLKGELQYCHIPVVLLTAKDSVKDQIVGLKAGADAYVTKPFNAEYLLSLMENLLTGRQRLRNALSENAGMDLPGDGSLSPQDRAFLKDLYALMDEELSNSEFNIGGIVDKMHISHSKFLYKVKGLTGVTPSELFKNYKLNKAAAMLREGKYNISEVSDLTGFSSLAHFSKVFKKKFGVPPSEFK
ncbi:MAG: response regulator [Bacteroidales bacterium]|nr:response regulator [Bacteroidales bacterium]